MELTRNYQIFMTITEGKVPISIKWVFNIKRDSNDNIIKYKAYHVACSFAQKQVIDFELTFSPTLNIDSLKLITTLTLKFQWKLIQFDINIAYLNAPLDKEIFISFPPENINFSP